MIWGGRDLERSSCPTPCHGQGHQDALLKSRLNQMSGNYTANLLKCINKVYVFTSARPVEAFEGPGSVTGMSFHPLVSGLLFLFPICSFAACTLVAAGESHKLKFVYCFLKL